MKDFNSSHNGKITENTSLNPDACPASMIQRQFWVLHSFAPDSPVYNIPLVSIIEGCVDADALESALNTLLARYRIFRAKFNMDDSGELVQSFAPLQKQSLPRIDLRPSQNAAADQATINSALTEEVRKPFDLSSDPLLRFTLFQTAENTFVLAITAHHIVFDLATSACFAQELAAAYSAAKKGCEAGQSIETADYALFCKWQERWLESDESRKMEAAWKNYLDGAITSLNLPFDRPEKKAAVQTGSIIPVRLPLELVDRIKTYSRKEAVIPFIVMLSAWSLTLARLTGQTRLTLGLPLTNRRRDEFKKTMGCFVNILPLALDFSDNPTLNEMLHRVRTGMLKMHRIQEVPYYRLVQMTRSTSKAQGNPLFHAGFTFEQPMQLELEDLSVKPIYIHHGGAQLDLFAKFWQENDSFTGAVEYDLQRLDPTAARRIVDQYLKTIRELCTEDHLKVGITKPEPTKDVAEEKPASVRDIRKSVDPRVLKWNETHRDYPLDRCLQSFIEEQVAKTPDTPALTYEDRTISYRELNKRVNQLAHFLQARGVGPEILVGVCAFRSMEMVIALLAIIKAGGAYVPFDPTYPVKRLSFMINDSRVPVILAHKTCSKLLEGVPSKILYFEDIRLQLETYPSDNPPIRTTPDNLAYVIYTSGSTGNPKGAMNTHKGIVNRLIWMQETFQIGTADTLVQKTPFSFDVSVWEFFWPFMCGAKLVVAKPEGHRDTDYLLNLIHKEKITIIHFVPSMLRLFLERAEQALCGSFRHVILSGEALTMDLQKRYFSILKAPLHNLYGPTEAAVDVSYWKCDPLSQSDTVPIGKPISNTRLWVLDKTLCSVPVGENGELHIGGIQVARGYINRPGLTAEKFIQDPFSDDPDARMYKTGDLCRFLPDGNIEYLGRIDFQVKIRGNRIELGEIENAILKDPSVKDCVVMVREDTPGEQRLVAYIIEKKGQFSLSAMRQKLATELPDYMIPAFFVLMPTFPLTPSGKTDRLALPKTGHERPELANKYIAPRGEMERLIVKMWQEILRIDTVGIDDNFFDLGGHSLLLVRLTNALNKAFNKKISVMILFEHPTVRKQVDFISGAINNDVNLSIEEVKATHPESSGSAWEEGEI